MKVTYYALRDIRVGDEVRQSGDLVPEAQMWPYLSGYIQDGKIAPVLVVTLPEEQQMLLMEWEEDVLGVTTEDVPADEIIEEKPPVTQEPAKADAKQAPKPKTNAKTGA